MTYLPRKRAKPRSGILRAPPREFDRHRRFVRQHECSIPNCPYQGERVEFAHIGPMGSKGQALKAGDWWGVPWCWIHHERATSGGHDTMCKENGTSMEAQRKIALALARKSPDLKMREAMYESLRLVTAEELEHVNA